MADETYEQSLVRDGRNLVALAGELPAVDFREAEVTAVLDHLERQRSVLVVGPSGVGKTSIIHAVAKELAARKASPIYEISTVALLSGTRYIGEWQTKVTRVANAAVSSKAILFVSDVWNLPRTGRTSSNDNNLLDALKPFLENKRLRLLAEATPEILRTMQRVPGFVRLFSIVDVPPLDARQVDLALERAAARKQVVVDLASRGALVKLTTRFLAARPQPGPALALLDDVIDYLGQKRGIGEDEIVSPAFVEKVFAITSGLPPFVVSRGVTMAADQIRAWFEARIVGQRQGINAVVESIALFKAGLHDPSKPIGTFLFVGPTGVGKTELARALATFIFGSAQRLLRFDLSEFKDYSSFELLLGDPDKPEQPARLIDPVRAHPFQVVLFDELEKAHANIWDLLLPLLDEGRLTAPGGDTVDFRNTILIATSNVGALDAAAKSVGFGESKETPEAREQVIKKALDRAFRPEFLNRFQHVVVFHALSLEQMRTVARQEMARVLTREGIAGQNLVVDVDDEALDQVIRDGVDERYGARALKREVQRRIVLPLALTLMEREVLADSILKVSARDGQLRIRVVETEESRAHKRELLPVRAPGGRAVTRSDLVAQMRMGREKLAQLEAALNVTALEAERKRLHQQRSKHDSWRDGETGERMQAELDRVATTLDRLERLTERADETAKALASPGTRATLEQLAHRVASFEVAVRDAKRDLVSMGWEGSADAIVEVRPVGGTGREARDLLVETYVGWAIEVKMPVLWLREPLEDDEPATLAIRGPYAFGLLRAEAGLHRLSLEGPEGRKGKLVIAQVRVGAWAQRLARIVARLQRPLKAVGHYGGKVRSRLECDGDGGGRAGLLVLQNERTLTANRELAAQLVEAWASLPVPDEALVVRRYDRAPPRVRDVLTGMTSGRADALAARAFDELLRQRVDAGAADEAPEGR